MTSGKETRGHRFMAPKPFSRDRLRGLRGEAPQGLRHPRREASARRSLEGRATSPRKGSKLIEDEGLLDENAGLTEWPVVLMGSFDESFLEVPPEVIVDRDQDASEMLFAEEGQDGKLANRFIVVANIEAAKDRRQGHRRRQ